MLWRNAYERLKKWKESRAKTALCVTGARQIGKTTIIREFGRREYENFAEINFVTSPDAAAIFDGELSADSIVTALTAYLRRPLEPGRTLILLDEIQICPNARTAIKFLIEDGRFDYIESGSMLGVRHREVRSYPVGFEEIFRMYPMDFREYVKALGVQDSTIEYLRSCFDGRRPVSDSVHETMKKLFASYIVVGGMPQVVQTYADTRDIGRVIALQRDILEQYRLDLSFKRSTPRGCQYADGADKLRIRAVFDSIPAQLNEKNRRFYLNSLDKNARMNRYENSFLWLAEAGAALPCYNVTEPRPPLQLNEKHSLFKLFMSDTGLLCAACMEDIQFALLNGNMEVNTGSVLENAIAQQLLSGGFALYYYDSPRHGEADFVVQRGTAVDIIEVKSGKDYKRHRALENVLGVSEWSFGNAFVLCGGNVETNGPITYLPWYMVMFIKQAGVPQGMIHDIDLSALEGI